MAVGSILSVSWICLLLIVGSLPFPSTNGYSYTSRNDHPDMRGDADDKLETSKTLMFDAYSLAKEYSDRRKKVPLAAAPKQPLLTPKEGARNQGGRAVEFGQKNAKIKEQKLVKPVTVPLNSPYQHDDSFDEQWGSIKPQFPSAYKQSTKQSSKLRKAGSDLIPSTPDLLLDDGAFSSGHHLESESGRYFNPAQYLNFPAGDLEGSQIYADQPSTLSYASYRSERGVPVFSSNSGNRAQAAPAVGTQTLEADAVSRIDTKGGYSSSSLHLDLPAGVQEGTQSSSPNLVYEDFVQYPAAETAQLPSEQGDPSNYASVNAVQPSTLSSASYMTGGEEPVFSSYSGNWAQAAPSVGTQTLEAASYMTGGEEPVFFSNSDNWAQAAPVETPAYQTYLAGSTLGSKSKATAQPPSSLLPVSFQPLKKAPQLPSADLLQRPKKVRDRSGSTYIIQSKGSYRRGRHSFSRKKYFSGYPPLPPFVLMAMRPKSETVRGKW